MNQSALSEPYSGVQKQIYKVYSIVEKPGDQKNVWLDIGIASLNRDDSISCKLDCLPINGIIQLRRYEKRSGGRNSAGEQFKNRHNTPAEQSGKAWQREGF